MTKTIPISEARQRLPTLVDKTNDLMDRYTITVKGKARAVLMSADAYESMRETMEIMSDPKLMEDIRQGEKDIAEGRVYDWEDVKKELGWDV